MTESINAISGLSRTPQITIPIAEANGIPIGISCIAGYGMDHFIVTYLCLLLPID